MPKITDGLTQHHYFCFICGKQLYDLCLGGLICECGKTFVPIVEPDGTRTLMCTNHEDNEPVKTSIIYIWPDDTWMYASEYEDIEMSHKSDDFAEKEISSDCDDECIEEIVIKYNKGEI